MICADPETMITQEAAFNADPNDPNYINASKVPDGKVPEYYKRVTDIFIDLARLGYM